MAGAARHTLGIWVLIVILLLLVEPWSSKLGEINLLGEISLSRAISLYHRGPILGGTADRVTGALLATELDHGQWRAVSRRLGDGEMTVTGTTPGDNIGSPVRHVRRLLLRTSGRVNAARACARFSAPDNSQLGGVGK